MGIFDMWREARGAVMRKELDDLLVRIGAANEWALSACYNNATQTIESLREVYRPATASERKALLRECRKSVDQMWNAGDWPSALGLGISALNVEAEFVPGKNAAYVKAETDKIILQAANYFQKKGV